MDAQFGFAKVLQSWEIEMTRHLAAILAADVVGYSAMMGADQEGTLAALRSLRSEVFSPTVAGHRGKVVKSMGDGWLVEFGSSADAVTCAMQVQDRVAGQEKIRLRIGIHIGDIVHEDEDVFGDGVNVAARLEALADPGTVAISDAVFGSLDGTLQPSFDDLGTRELKNISRPIQVWGRGKSASGSADRVSGNALSSQTGFPQLAVLPVSSSDVREEISELASALTADFANFLGGARWLKSRVQEVPSPSANVLETVLRARGDRLRLEARVLAPDGAQLWTGKYDGSLADSFDWQDEVGSAIASETLTALLDHERARLAGKTLDEMSAKECYVSGLMSVELVDWDAMSNALECLAAAIEKDPSFTEAYSDAIVYYFAASSIGYADLVEFYGERFGQWMAAAGAHIQASPMIELALGIGMFRSAGDVTALRRAIRSALRRAPFTIEVVLFSGWGHAWMGEPEPAIDCFRQNDRAIRFSPFVAAAAAGLSFALLQAGKDEEAILEAKRGLELTTEFSTLHRVIASASAHLGRMEEAYDALRENERINPGDTIQMGWKRNAFADTPGTRRYYEGLRLAGMPEGDE
ncbi:adenylate/guanylate cyclase domain-containing protein [Falsiruegeria mediterranea]